MQKFASYLHENGRYRTRWNTSVMNRSMNVETADLFNRRLKLDLDRENPQCIRSNERVGG